MPFVIQIVWIVGLVGYLSFRNGQQAVDNVAHQLRGGVTARIKEHLRTFLIHPTRSIKLMPMPFIREFSTSMIRLHRDNEMITLQVSDDGVGSFPDFDFANIDSVGMKAILGIGEHHLQGKVTVETDNGVTWQIQFEDNLYKSRV
jgi:hypothetical protein